MFHFCSGKTAAQAWIDPPATGSKTLDLRRTEDAWHQTRPRFGPEVPTAAVQQKRKSLGIPVCPEKHFWRPEDDNLLGKYSDDDVARFLKVSVQSLVMRRSKLGLRIRDSKVRPWTSEEEALVGTKPDAEVARILGRSIFGHSLQTN